MTLTVLAPAYFPDLSPAHYLVRSAALHELAIEWYGLGTDYHSWYQVQIADLIGQVERAESSHILYTDSRDVIVCGGQTLIEQRYKELGRPPLLISSETDGLNAGGWMGRRRAALDALGKLLRRTGDWNPQTRWREAVADGSVEVVVDDESRVFHVMEGELPRPLPCFLHFAGGYNDPRTGRAERMQPVWEALGY